MSNFDSTPPPTRPPLTLPFDCPPQVFDGRRNSPSAPLYGLGWRCPATDVFHKHDHLRLSSIPFKICSSRWRKYYDQFIHKIRFEPYFVMDLITDDVFCFAMFNKDAKIDGGPEGKAFVEAPKECMLISPEEDSTFMWYKCSSRL